jgi:hypothetical protein
LEQENCDLGSVLLFITHSPASPPGFVLRIGAGAIMQRRQVIPGCMYLLNC